MLTTPIEHLASLRVGTVEYISPDRIEVQLDIESPDSVALNTGTPRNFPRINSYVMIPIDLGFVVGGNVTVISSYSGNVIVNVKGARIAISEGMAQKIFV